MQPYDEFSMLADNAAEAELALALTMGTAADSCGIDRALTFS